MKKIQLITDGACIGNPGPGGWACILRYGDKKREIYGSEPHTTNNRMELKAAVEGLRALKEPCEVEIVTDSNYLKNGITELDPEVEGATAGARETRSRWRIRTCGTNWMKKYRGTRPNGPGRRDTRRTPTTTAAMNWHRRQRGGSFPASEARAQV